MTRFALAALLLLTGCAARVPLPQPEACIPLTILQRNDGAELLTVRHSTVAGAWWEHSTGRGGEGESETYACLPRDVAGITITVGTEP